MSHATNERNLKHDRDDAGPANVEAAVRRLEAALQEKSDRLDSLVRIGTSVVSSDDFDHVLQVIGFEISRFLDFQHISVAVLEPTKRSYRLVASATSYPDADGLVTGW
ncbi:MAG: hypothetical protein R6V58_12735 [Planctomycetota bacterium]